jgi:hemin uptake protein HemP
VSHILWQVSVLTHTQADKVSGDTVQGNEAVESRLRVVESSQLFEGHTEIAIRHAGETYRLRITRQGKLILNK